MPGPIRAGAGAILVLALPSLLSGCGAREEAEAPDRETISQEAFISTFVALRRGALASEEGVITGEQRERILAEQGVTEEELLTFVEVHGRRIDFMEGVWNEVEARVLGRDEADTLDPDDESPPDTLPGEEGPGTPDRAAPAGGPGRS